MQLDKPLLEEMFFNKAQDALDLKDDEILFIFTAQLYLGGREGAVV